MALQRYVRESPSSKKALQPINLDGYDVPTVDYICDFIIPQQDPAQLHMRYYYLLDLYISFIFSTYRNMCASTGGLLFDVLGFMAPENWKDTPHYLAVLYDKLHSLFQQEAAPVGWARMQALSMFDRTLQENPPSLPTRAKATVELVFLVFGLLKFPSFRQALAPVPPPGPDPAPAFKVTDYPMFEQMLLHGNIRFPEPTVAQMFESMLEKARIVPSREDQDAFELVSDHLYAPKDEDGFTMADDSKASTSSQSVSIPSLKYNHVEHTKFNITGIECFAWHFATMYTVLACTSNSAIEMRETQNARIHQENYSKIARHVQLSGYQSMT